MARSKNKVNFEKSLSALEAIVHKLEDGELSLEASLNAFEEGVKLTRECQGALSEAEQRVQQLVNRNGESLLEDFTTDEDEP